MAEKKRRLVGEGFFRMFAERWGVKDVDALLDELDPKVSLAENWDLFKAALAKRGIYPEPEALSEAEEKQRYLSWLDSEVRRSGLLDELYDKITELSAELIERDLALSKLDEEKRRLEEERRELKITATEYERRAAWLKKLEEDLKKWSEELTRLQFRVPVLSGKEAGEEIERVRKVKPGLTREQIKRLEDEFRAALFKDLGRIPRDAMAEFRVELEKVKMLPYEEALNEIVGLAREIAWREAVKPPIVKAPPEVRPPVPVGVPPEVPPVVPPYVPPVELPKKALSPLPFPRRPAREEKDIILKAFDSAMADIGYMPSPYYTALRERIFEWMFKDWDAVLKEFKDLVDDIRLGRVLIRVPVIPWVTKEQAILHFFSIGWGNADDIVEELILGWGIKTDKDEVIRVVKEAWKAKVDPRFAYYTEEALQELLEKGKKIGESSA